MSVLHVEILAFEGCPNASQARLNAAEAIRLEGCPAHISEIEIDTPERAQVQRFLGSPSIRVNGSDVEDGADMRNDYGLMCRTYHEGETLAGSPSVASIRAAIRSSKPGK